MSKIVRIDGGIVVEIFAEMPVFTAELMAQIRGDAPDDVQQGWVFDGASYAAPVLPAPTPEQIERQFVMAVQGLLDTKAQERRYDNILSACSYATSTDEKFAAEGQACVAWRDAVWLRCYEDLAKVQAGEMAMPTIEDFLASLPTLTWPA